MPTTEELESNFWKALKSDRVVMLGLQAFENAHARPMTAQLDGEQGPIWFFTARDNRLVHGLGSAPQRAFCTFAAKDHELFAFVHGSLLIETDRAMVDRLWNPFVAAWYEGGKDDPNLVLLRLDPEQGEVWLNESSLFAGIKMLLGMDPKKEYRGKVATVDLG